MDRRSFSPLISMPNSAIIYRLIQPKLMSDENQQTALFVDEKTQKELNTPLRHIGTTQNKEFLEILIKMISEGKINLYQPGSLINHSVYDKLDDAAKGKADLELQICLLP